MRREPEVATAAAGSTCTSVTRGPWTALAAAPANPSTARTPSTPANVPRYARRRRASRRRRRVGSVLIRVLRLVDERNLGGSDLQGAVGRRAHGAGDGDPLPLDELGGRASLGGR